MDSDIILVTANIGGIDPVFELPSAPGIESLYVTDDTSVRGIPGWTLVHHTEPCNAHLPPRLHAKLYKCQVHRISGVDRYRWIAWADASLRFGRMDFVADVVQALVSTGRDATFVPHPNRRSPAAEYSYILGWLRNGTPSKPVEYLRRRYDAGALERERAHFQDRGHDLAALSLWCGGFWVVRNVPKVHGFLDEWWETVKQFSIVDQPAISPLLVEHGVAVLPLDVNIYSNRYWEREAHE